MQDNTVVVDRSASPSGIRFAPRFNAAVPFIDRHLDEGRGAKPAIRTVDEEVTYAALAERVNRCGNLLKSLGIGPGERMLMVVKDSPEFFYLFWGAIKAGIIPVPLNTLLRAEDYRFLIEDSGCAAFVYSPETEAEAEAALAAVAHRPASALATQGKGSVQDLMATADTALAPAPATPTDDCFWLYSSGSTGNPKGVVHGHRDMVITSERYAFQIIGVREDDTVFSGGKLFFSYGFGNAMTFPLWAGATIVLSDRRTAPEMTFEIIEQFRPTIFFGVPTLYGQQLHAMETRKPDLGSLRFCVSAGEALPGNILERWRNATGLTIVDGLGSTEALHIFISNRHDDVRPGASGRVVPGYEVKIVDDDGEAVEPGEIGTLWVKGESTARTYWNNPEKTASTMVGDWLNTGDMYYQDEEGYYVNAGRGDDMLKVGGMWCSPFEIESRLLEHPDVIEAAVVGRLDEDEMVKPEAFLVLRQADMAGEAMVEALREHCRTGLDRYKYPRWFNFVDQLPKTTTGKIQRFKLRA